MKLCIKHNNLFTKKNCQICKKEWDNKYYLNNKSMYDEDSSTWTWQIDHIIPQTKLPYTSMEDENFKICWSLNNLRPYSAKQNLLDGNKRKINL